jgi:DNA ligase D-like protein (predicted polymerase)
MPKRAEALEIDVGGRAVRVSNPGKLMFPEAGVTKEDLVRYYIAVGAGMLAAVRDRPLTLRRYPDGVDGESFFQKRVPKGAPDWLETVQIRFPSGRAADEICPTEVAVLAWAANLGTLEFHPWPVSRADVEHPAQLRVDFDPQPGTSFRDAVTVAREARELLAELGMTGFVKTSGGRGVHLSMRIVPEWDFVQVRRAVIALGRELERRLPALVTTSWWKEERGERIFIDYNQAARDRTIVAAYSARAVPEATVSAPVTWEELDQVEPGDFTVATMPARQAAVADPHAGLNGPDAEAFRLDPLLEMSAADERDRDLGDLPYPPDYPKMPGEPPRVQPSRKNPLNWLSGPWPGWLSRGAVRFQADGAADIRVTFHAESRHIADQLDDPAFELGVAVDGSRLGQPPGRHDELAQAHMAFRWRGEPPRGVVGRGLEPAQGGPFVGRTVERRDAGKHRHEVLNIHRHGGRFGSHVPGHTRDCTGADPAQKPKRSPRPWLTMAMTRCTVSGGRSAVTMRVNITP